MSETRLPCVISEARDCKANPSETEVFIIGPGSREFTKDIEKIHEVIKNFGFEPYFALLSEEEKGLDSFCDKICTKIRSDVFCIVLLNDPIICEYFDNESKMNKIVRAPRANVYYEYGLAVAFGQKVIPIIRKDMKLPFDIQHLDAILYEDAVDLHGKLTDAIRATLVKGIKPKAAAKVPRIGLSLVGKDGKSTNLLTANPIITKLVKKETKKLEVPETALSNIEWISQLRQPVYNHFAKKTPAKDLVPIEIEVWNEGEVPGSNIVVFLDFPPTCELFDQYEIEDVPSIYNPSTKPTFGGLYVVENTKQAKAWLDRLGNDRRQSDFDKIYVRFNTEEEKTFDITGIVIQDNFPSKEFAFRIEVKPILETVNDFS